MGSCASGELSRSGIVLMGSCASGELSRSGIVLMGSRLGWSCPLGEPFKIESWSSIPLMPHVHYV